MLGLYQYNYWGKTKNNPNQNTYTGTKPVCRVGLRHFAIGARWSAGLSQHGTSYIPNLSKTSTVVVMG